MTFADGTSVPVARSKAELDALLSRYGAGQRAFGSDDAKGEAWVVFSMGTGDGARQVRLKVPLPKLEAFAKRRRGGNGWSKNELVTATPEHQQKAWEQACRERWRAVLLLCKAKLEMIEMGMSTVEREFMADLYLADGTTVGEKLAPLIAKAYAEGVNPPLMLGSGS